MAGRLVGTLFGRRDDGAYIQQTTAWTRGRRSPTTTWPATATPDDDDIADHEMAGDRPFGRR
jgi:hypothetical protein